MGHDCQLRFIVQLLSQFPAAGVPGFGGIQVAKRPFGGGELVTSTHFSASISGPLKEGDGFLVKLDRPVEITHFVLQTALVL